MQPYKKNSASTGDYRGSKAVVSERVIEGLQSFSLDNSDLQLTYDSPKNVVVNNINGTKIILPDATTLINGWTVFLINDDKVNNCEVYLYSDIEEKEFFNSIEAGKMIQCLLLDNTTQAGKWKMITTGEFGSTELESKYTTSVYDTSVTSYGQLSSGTVYKKVLTTIPVNTPVKSIFIKQTEKFIGPDIYVAIGTEEEPDKLYKEVKINGEITQFTKDLFEEILSTEKDTDLIATFYTKSAGQDNWILTDIGTANNIENSFYENSLFTLLTNQNEILTSPTTSNFHKYTITDFDFRAKSVIYENGYFYFATNKEGKFTIAKTNDFETWNYFDTDIYINATPDCFIKCNGNYIAISNGLVLSSQYLEQVGSWNRAENEGIQDIIEVSASDRLCVISCSGYYFTTDDGITFSQFANNEGYSYKFLDNNWIRFIKNSTETSTISYSEDFATWYDKDINLLNINDIQFLNKTFFIFTAAEQYPDMGLAISRQFFEDIKQINIEFANNNVYTVCGTPANTLIAGENGTASYSSGEDFFSLTSGRLEIVVEKVKEINPQTIKNPIINTNVPTGTIFSYPFSDIPAGYARLDGSLLLDAKAAYPEFTNKLINSSKDFKNILINYETYEYGLTEEERNNCGKFSWADTTERNLRLPKINGFIRGAGDSLTIADLVGTYQTDTMRKITGGVCKVNEHENQYQTQWTSGAFYREGAGAGNGVKGGSADGYTAIKMDSSRLGDNYNGVEVQPKHVRYPYIICVYQSVQETATATLDSIQDVLKKNQDLLTDSKALLAESQSVKSDVVRQCVIDALTTNYTRHINGLNIICDQGVYGTCAQGFTYGTQTDIKIDTSLSALSYTLPRNAKGSVYLEKNINDNSVKINYTERWVESATKPADLVIDNIWYDLLHQKLYKAGSGDSLYPVYAVKIADFETNASSVTSYTCVPFRLPTFSDAPDYNNAMSRTVGTKYTSNMSGWVLASTISGKNAKINLYVNDILMRVSYSQESDWDSNASTAMIRVSPNDTYQLRVDDGGKGYNISTYLFIPCKGEFI